MKIKKTQSPIEILTNVVRGYATHDQIDAALSREKQLIDALEQARRAMKHMRSMLRNNSDISLDGGEIARVMSETDVILGRVATVNA